MRLIYRRTYNVVYQRPVLPKTNEGGYIAYGFLKTMETTTILHLPTDFSQLWNIVEELQPEH